MSPAGTSIPRGTPPWPAYDSNDAETIVTLAGMAGLAGEALAYERENQNRPEIVDRLEALESKKRAGLGKQQIVKQSCVTGDRGAGPLAPASTARVRAPGDAA